MTENFLNIQSYGRYGLDSVGLGVDPFAGLTLSKTVVAGISTEPFYLGKLGLKSSRSTGLNDSTATLMSQLKKQNPHPKSLIWLRGRCFIS